MDKGDYINVMILNRSNKGRSKTSWENSFDAELPPAFGKQTSLQAKQYNKNLLNKQFPESGGNASLKSPNEVEVKEPSFSPKREYIRHMKHEAMKHKGDSIACTADLPCAPAWSLGGREWPPDMQRPWMSVGDYEVSGVDKCLSTKRSFPAFTLSKRLISEYDIKRSNYFKTTNGTGLLHTFPESDGNKHFPIGIKTPFLGLGGETASPGPAYNVSGVTGAFTKALKKRRKDVKADKPAENNSNNNNPKKLAPLKKKKQ